MGVQTVDVSSSEVSDITTKFAAFVPTYRRTAVGLVTQLLREVERRDMRRGARRRYNSERRSAVTGGSAGGRRLRAVGHDCVGGNKQQQRANKLGGL